MYIKQSSTISKIENAWNLDFHGIKLSVTQFGMQFTQVARLFWVYLRQLKNCLGKTVL